MEGASLEESSPFNCRAFTSPSMDTPPLVSNMQDPYDDWISLLLNESPELPLETEVNEFRTDIQSGDPFHSFSCCSESPISPVQPSDLTESADFVNGSDFHLGPDSTSIPVHFTPIEITRESNEERNEESFREGLISGSVSNSVSPSNSASNQIAMPNTNTNAKFPNPFKPIAEGSHDAFAANSEATRPLSNFTENSQSCSMNANFHSNPYSNGVLPTINNFHNLHKDLKSDPSQSYSPESANSTGASEGLLSLDQIYNPTSKHSSRSRKIEAKNVQNNSMNGTDSEGSDGGKACTEDEKREARLLRNRQSAQLSRQRKKYYMDELESQLKTMTATVAELNTTIAHLTNENVNLRRQLAMYQQPGTSGNRQVSNPSTAMSMPNSYPPLGFLPGMPMGVGNTMASCPPVPIPRLKSSLALASAKPGKRAKAATKSTSEPAPKGRKKMKKTTAAATVTALALCLCTFFFSPLNTVNTITSGDSKPNWLVPNATRHEVRAGGRVLMSFDEKDKPANKNSVNQSMFGGSVFSTHSSLSLPKFSIPKQEVKEEKVKKEIKGKQPAKIFLTESNNSDPSNIPASLVMTRGNQRVQVDGNFIIQAVKAGDKAAMVYAKERNPENDGMDGKKEDKGGKMIQLLSSQKRNLKHVAMLAMKAENKMPSFLKALPAFTPSNDHESSASEDFIFDSSGTIFSSGVCREVFQFESTVSKSHSDNLPTDLLSQNTLSKLSQRQSQNHTQSNVRMMRSGRDPFAIPIPLKKNDTSSKTMSQQSKISEHATPFNADHCSENKGKGMSPSSSMVVSLLATPRDLERGNEKARNGENEFSHIFVVVLVNGVKYVTYACMLPMLS